MNAFFKSVIDQDRAPVVICDLNHAIMRNKVKMCT